MNFFGAILLALAAVLQAIVLPVLMPDVVEGAHLRPDLLVLLVASVSLVDSLHQGLIWGFAGGLLFDLFSPVPLGTHALALLLVALLASLGAASPFRSHFIMPLAIVAICTVFYYLFMMALLSLFGQQMDLVSSIIYVVMPALVMNVILTPVFYTLIFWLSNRLRPSLPEEWQ